MLRVVSIKTIPHFKSQLFNIGNIIVKRHIGALPNIHKTFDWDDYVKKVNRDIEALKTDDSFDNKEMKKNNDSRKKQESNDVNDLQVLIASGVYDNHHIIINRRDCEDDDDDDDYGGYDDCGGGDD